MKNFHSEIKSVDFGNPELASETINSWVKVQTKDKIQELMDPSMINPAFTMLVLGKKDFNFCNVILVFMFISMGAC